MDNTSNVFPAHYRNRTAKRNASKSCSAGDPSRRTPFYEKVLAKANEKESIFNIIGRGVV